MSNSLAMAYAMKKRKKMGAEMPEIESEHEPMGGDIVDKAMRKKFADGGMVETESEEADSKSADYDYLDTHEAPESTNSGAADGDFLGDAREDEDRHDIVARAMKQRSMKQRNPRPA